jgi:signal-transduction protein with cAMP-binding, CBS, and nucleotidyltransferase domain
MSLKTFMPVAKQEVAVSTPIRKALILMDSKNCDALLIKQFGDYIGIITRFDIHTKIIDVGLNIDSCNVGMFMNLRLLTINESVTSSQALRVMKKCKIKHLVVEEEGFYIGLVSESKLRSFPTVTRTFSQPAL